MKDKLSNVKDISSLRNFYNSNLAQLFYGNIEEKDEKKILNSITIKELKDLYSIISPLPIAGSKKKKDIIYMFKYYFDDESRTNDISRKLTY